MDFTTRVSMNGYECADTTVTCSGEWRTWFCNSGLCQIALRGSSAETLGGPPMGGRKPKGRYEREYAAPAPSRDRRPWIV